MASKTPAGGDKQAKAGGAAPPDEQFWKRYSPHHEFPLSSAASFGMHALAIAFLVLFGILAARFGWGDSGAPLPVEALDYVEGGGGGSETGQGNGPGDAPPAASEAASDVKPDPNTPPSPPTSPEALAEATPDPLTLPELTDQSGRVFEDASAAVKALQDVSADARKQLFKGLGPGKGQGGSGSGGGKDKGKDKGEGALEGPGKGKISARQKRVLRWVMIFNTANPDDYRNQLRELGAILAYPDQKGGYRVLRELVRPARGEIEDLDKIKRIFWVDDKPQSVGSLSHSLGISPPPPHFVAFFPEKLEADLLQKELKYRGKKEEDIKETRFRVARHGGKYEPVVEDQR